MAPAIPAHHHPVANQNHSFLKPSTVGALIETVPVTPKHDLTQIADPYASRRKNFPANI